MRFVFLLLISRPPDLGHVFQLRRLVRDLREKGRGALWRVDGGRRHRLCDVRQILSALRVAQTGHDSFQVNVGYRERRRRRLNYWRLLRRLRRRLDQLRLSFFNDFDYCLDVELVDWPAARVRLDELLGFYTARRCEELLSNLSGFL